MKTKSSVIEYIICTFSGIVCAFGLSIKYPLSFDGFRIVYAILAAAIAAFIYITWRHHKRYSNRREVIWKIICLIFGVLNTWGNYVVAYDRIPLHMSVKHIAASVFLSCVYGFMFYLITYWVRYFLCNRLVKSVYPNFTSKQIFIIAFVVILLCWIPWVIAYYPASMDYDVFRMLKVYLGIMAKDNHHPWFACCVLGLFYDLGVKLGSENIGIFIFVVIRDILIALIYAETIRVMKRAGVRRLFCVLALLYFAVTPVWGAYAKHAFKDTFATALFCLTVTWMISLMLKVENGEDRLIDYLKYGFAGLFASLFRNNIIYCVVPATLLLIIWLLVKKRKIWRIAIMLACILIYFAYNAYIFNVEGVKKSRSAESMSIFLQQTGRTVRDRDDTITREEKEVLYEYFNYDEIADYYDPILSDMVKNRIREEWRYKVHPEYFKTWLKMGIEHPGVYVEAFVAQNSGYYAFVPEWPEDSGYGNCGMTIFNTIESFEQDLERFTFAYNDSTEGMRALLEKWAYLWNYIPLLNITNMIAVYTWTIILIASILIRRRRAAYLIPVVCTLLLIATCLASPINGCFRYFAQAAASLPVLLSLVARSERR